MEDKVTEAAEAEIESRAKRFQGVALDVRPVSYGMATMDDLTRIRYELTAIRRVLERLAEK